MNWKHLKPDELDHDELLVLVKNYQLEFDKISAPFLLEQRRLKTQLANEKRKVKSVYKKYRAWRIKHRLPHDELSNFEE